MTTGDTKLDNCWVKPYTRNNDWKSAIESGRQECNADYILKNYVTCDESLVVCDLYVMIGMVYVVVLYVLVMYYIILIIILTIIIIYIIIIMIIIITKMIILMILTITNTIIFFLLLIVVILIVD